MANRRHCLVAFLLLLVGQPVLATDPRRIMVFGDSLAWGWIPQPDGFPSQRYPADLRWPGVLQTELGAGYQVVEESLPGRTTDLTPPLESAGLPGAGYNGAAYLPAAIASQMPLDLVIVALGSNDLRSENHRTPLEIGLGAMRLATIVQASAGTSGAAYPAPEVLLLAPPPLPASVATGPFGHVFGAEASAKSQDLGPVYQRLAAAADMASLDAGQVIRTDGVDSVHLSMAAHAALGRAVARAVTKLLPPPY